MSASGRLVSRYIILHLLSVVVAALVIDGAVSFYSSICSTASTTQYEITPKPARNSLRRHAAHRIPSPVPFHPFV